MESERIQEKYARRCLDVERCTKIYMILEKTKRYEIRVRVGQRVMQYEEKIRNATGMEYLKEKQSEITKTKNIQERREYLTRNG